MNYLAQLIGLIASCILIIGMQAKKKKTLLIFTAIGDILFVVNFILLGAYTGALICFLSSTESIIISIFESKQKKQPKILLPIFLISALVGGAITYENIYSIIPIICSLLFVTSALTKKIKHIRKVILLLYALWVTYDIIVGAYTSVISDVFIALSSLIAIIRYDIKRPTKKRKS